LPWAIWLNRAPWLRMTPQPVQVNDGSRPRISIAVPYPFSAQSATGMNGSRSPNTRSENTQGRGCRNSIRALALNSSGRLAERSHNLVRDIVIAPDSLDVVIVFQHIDQLEQRADIAFAHFRHQIRLPGKLNGFRLPQNGLQILGNLVQHIHASPDGVAVFRGFHVIGARLNRGF